MDAIEERRGRGSIRGMTATKFLLDEAELPTRWYSAGQWGTALAFACAQFEEALRCKETGESKVILTALCGHARRDLPAYDAYLSGRMVDHELDASAVDAAIQSLPPVAVE